METVANRVTDLSRTVDIHEILIKLTAGDNELSIWSINFLSVTKQLFSHTETWAPTDPATEDITRIVDLAIHSNYQGYDQTVIEELRTIASGTSTIITKLVGQTEDIHICKGAVLSKKIITPVIEMSTRAKYTESLNGLWKNVEIGSEIMFSFYGLFSEFTTLLRKNIRVVGRLCEITGDVTVESGRTDNFLNEALPIHTNKTFTLTKTFKNK